MRLVLFISAFAVCFSGCTKDGAVLPAPTTTGAQTFGCTVDGRVFISYGTPQNGIPGGISSHLIKSGPWPRISLNADQNNPRMSVSIAFNFKDTVGRYELNAIYPYRGIYADISGSSTAVNGSNEYLTTDQHIGYVIVTKYANNIVSGTFEFDAVNDSNRLVKVRDGRFDVQLQY